MKFLENNKILRDFQHDLRKRTSCETQLITSIHDLSVDLDRWKQVGTILLDFSKAFDIALHHCLEVKLHHYDIRTYPGSKVSLQIGISKLYLMGRYLLLQLSHLEFHRVQYSDLSSSWFTSMTCPVEIPLQYNFSQRTIYCTELFKTRRMQSHNRQGPVVQN